MLPLKSEVCIKPSLILAKDAEFFTFHQIVIILYYPCTNLDLLIFFLFSLHFSLSLHIVVGYLLLFSVAVGLLEYVGEAALAPVLGGITS